jgi:hypothetical protein
MGFKLNPLSGQWDYVNDSVASSNSFETIQVPSGTSPVAESSTDTLTLSAGTGISITGDSTTDTVTFAVDTNVFVPYTGATADLDLGAFNAVGDIAYFNTVSSPSTGIEIKLNSGQIVDSANLISADFEARTLKNNAEVTLFDFNTSGALYNDMGNLWASPFTMYNLGGATVRSDFSTLEDGSGGVCLNWGARTLYYTDGTTVALDWSRSTYSFGVYINTLQVDNIFPATNSSVSFGSGGDGDVFLRDIYFNTSGGKFYDGSNIKAFEATTAQRQLFDFGGSYPSVDYGNYQLYCIPISNSYPKLDWSSGAGNSVIIYDVSTGVVCGDFSNYLLADSSGNTTVSWGSRLLHDNYNLISVDWDYHLLSYNNAISINWETRKLKHSSGLESLGWEDRYAYDSNGTYSIDWENKILSHFGNPAMDWQYRRLIDSSSNTSIQFEDRHLKASDGTTTVLNYATQQTTAVTGATRTAVVSTNIQTGDTFDGYTVAQIVGALRAYGLLA